MSDIDLPDLNAKVYIDTSELDKAVASVDRVGGELDKAASHGGGLGRALHGVFTAAAAVGGIAASAVAVAGGIGLKTAAAAEQASISFTTMLGSATKARSFLGQLQTFAAKTPFEFPELQTAASSLISVGVEASSVIPIMTSLGNATSGMGTGAEGVQRATLALQQMSAAGRISGEDLNQLRDAGVPVFDLLAAATGKSVAQVAKLADTGKLGKRELNQLFAALESGKGLERFNGLMDKQSASLNGMVSTLKDTVSQGLARAVQPWLPAIKQGLGNVSTALGPFFDSLAAKSAELAAKMPELLAKLRGFITKVRALFTGDGGPSLLDRIKDAVARLRAELSQGGGEGSTAEAWSKLKDAAQQLWQNLPQLLSALPSLHDTISVTATVVGFAADHLDTLAKILPAVAIGFAAIKIAQAASNVALVAAIPLRAAEVASNFALAASNRQVAAAYASKTVTQDVATVTQSRSTIATVAGTVASVAARAAVIAWTAVQWLLNAALTANPIGLVIAAIALLIGGIILAYQHSETFRNIIQAVWRGIQAVVGAVIGWLQTAIPAAWSFIKGVTSSVFNAVLAVVRFIWGAIKLYISVYVFAIKAVIQGLAAIPGLITGWFSRARDGAVRMLSALVTFVSGIPGKILSALGALGSLLYNVGRDMISGLINGIKDMAGNVASAALDAAKGAVNAVKGFLHIGSPSKLMHEIGVDTGQGLANGIEAAAGVVADAATTVASAAVPAISPLTQQLRMTAEGAVAPAAGAGVPGPALVALTPDTLAALAALLPDVLVQVLLDSEPISAAVDKRLGSDAHGLARAGG